MSYNYFDRLTIKVIKRIALSVTAILLGLPLDRSHFVTRQVTYYWIPSMTPYQKRLCPLTRHLAEDMKIRHMAGATIDAYTYHRMQAAW